MLEPTISVEIRRIGVLKNYGKVESWKIERVKLGWKLQSNPYAICMSAYLWAMIVPGKWIKLFKIKPSNRNWFVRPSKDSDIGTAQSDANWFIRFDWAAPTPHSRRALFNYMVHT